MPVRVREPKCLVAENDCAIYCQPMTTYRFRQLGSSGPSVFPLGLGCMGMSDMYGPADEAESIATIHAALDAGITLLERSPGSSPKGQLSCR